MFQKLMLSEPGTLLFVSFPLLYSVLIIHTFIYFSFLFLVYLNLCIAPFVLTCSLQGRGSEVVLLPGDENSMEGGENEENANKRTVSELLSLNPHENNVFITILLETFKYFV